MERVIILQPTLPLNDDMLPSWENWWLETRPFKAVHLVENILTWNKLFEVGDIYSTIYTILLIIWPTEYSLLLKLFLTIKLIFINATSIRVPCYRSPHNNNNNNKKKKKKKKKNDNNNRTFIMCKFHKMFKCT